MNPKMNPKMVVGAVPIILGILAAVGCSHPAAEQKQAQSLGAAMQRNGMMSQ